MARRRLADNRGRLAAVAVVAAYFLAFWAIGGADSWHHLGVRPALLSFADMRSLTSAWECTDQGLEVLPENPCDPLGERPANYPRLWLAPSSLGIGQESTVALGVAAAIAFFVAFLYLVGGVGSLAGVICGLAFVSPAAMLGIERGNVDVVLFAMLVAALALFRRAPALRLISYALLLLTAMLKVFPVFAWGVLLRQGRTRMLLSVGLLAVAFGVYLVAIADTIETIQEVVPQGIQGYYGADVGVDSLQSWASTELSIDWLGSLADGMTLAVVAAAILLIAFLAGRWRGGSTPGDGVRDLHLDAFVAGAGIFVGTFLVFHNFDYRLIFLMLTLPQLIAWWETAPCPVPAPRLTTTAVLAAMWLGEPLSAGVGFWIGPIEALTYLELGFALEELFNWFACITLGAGLARVLLDAIRSAGGNEPSPAAA